MLRHRYGWQALWERHRAWFIAPLVADGRPLSQSSTRPTMPSRSLAAASSSRGSGSPMTQNVTAAMVWALGTTKSRASLVIFKKELEAAGRRPRMCN